MQIVLIIKKIVSIVMKIIIRNEDFHLEQSEDDFSLPVLWIYNKKHGKRKWFQSGNIK